MTATVINPSAMPVTFEGWHKNGSDVTIHAIQVLSAYRLLPLASKGMKFRPATSPVRFLNQTFGRKLSAERWQELLAPVVEQIKA
jgi:hypothetical protein